VTTEEQREGDLFGRALVWIARFLKFASRQSQ
jgi:hypothetical protein